MTMETQNPRAQQTERPIKNMKKQEGLYEYVKPLASLSAGMLYLAQAGHEKLTINQAVFFLLVAAADARGSPLTLQEILESSDGVLSPSIKNSYKALLEVNTRTEKERYALGWISREADPDDERRKYLRLTKKGREVALAVMLATGQLKARPVGGTHEPA